MLVVSPCVGRGVNFWWILQLQKLTLRHIQLKTIPVPLLSITIDHFCWDQPINEGCSLPLALPSCHSPCDKLHQTSKHYGSSLNIMKMSVKWMHASFYVSHFRLSMTVKRQATRDEPQRSQSKWLCSTFFDVRLYDCNLVGHVGLFFSWFAAELAFCTMLKCAELM